ncbi:hypothetical protein [Rahnella aquatilis]|uniref:hypothetical protein n=1 Tax=Rahnella aquatilis TaxID=34038 RepID=UPI0036568341
MGLKPVTVNSSSPMKHDTRNCFGAGHFEYVGLKRKIVPIKPSPSIDYIHTNIKLVARIDVLTFLMNTTMNKKGELMSKNEEIPDTSISNEIGNAVLTLLGEGETLNVQSLIVTLEETIRTLNKQSYGKEDIPAIEMAANLIKKFI